MAFSREIGVPIGIDDASCSSRERCGLSRIDPVASRLALIMDQPRLRNVSAAEAAFFESHAIVDVAKADVELFLIESAHIQEHLAMSQQTSAGHRDAAAGKCDHPLVGSGFAELRSH